MEAQCGAEGPVPDPAQDAQERQRLAERKAKQDKSEKIGLAILLIGFASVLIPKFSAGKYGEWTMFAGAIWYFSARHRYR